MSTAPGSPLPFEVPPPSTTDKRASGLRLDGSLIALGVGLLSTAVVISTVYSRRDGDLDWSNYAVGLAATATLVLGALLGRTAVKDAAIGRHLVSWPIAFGAVATGLMTQVGLEGLDDFDHGAYVVGGVVAVVGVIGYLLSPSAPPAVAAMLGSVVVYAQASDDVLAEDTFSGDNAITAAALVITVFVLGVTLLAAALRPARVVVGVTAGFGAVVGFLGLLAGIGFVGVMSSFGGAGLDDGGFSDYGVPDFDDQIYTMLGLAALLVLVWLWLAHVTDSPGYRVLVVAMLTTVVPGAMAALVVDHPSWWGAALGVVGAVVLGTAGLRALRSGGSTGGPTLPVTYDHPHTPPLGGAYAPPLGSASGNADLATPPGGAVVGEPPPPPSYLGG